MYNLMMMYLLMKAISLIEFQLGVEISEIALIYTYIYYMKQNLAETETNTACYHFTKN